MTQTFERVDQKFAQKYEYIEKKFPVLITNCVLKELVNPDGSTTPIGEVTALVNIYGIIDDGDDIVELGVFVKSIQEQFGRIRCLDQHNTDSVIRVVGKPIEIKEIRRGELPPELLDKWPDATGALKTVTRYMLDDPTSLAVYNRVSREYINEYSIGFFIVKFSYDRVTVDGKQKSVRRIQEGSLLEYSNVIWGMNPATMTQDVKERDMTPPARKEYGPEGPERKLGEYVKASVYDCWTYCINQLMSEGMINDTEHLALAEGGLEILRMMGGLLGEDISLRPYEYMPMFFLWGNDFVDRQVKEGRVLSQASVNSLNSTVDDIESAAEKIRELIRNAGYGTVESEDEEGKANPQPAEPERVSATLTEQERAELLRQIQLTELELLEVEHDRTYRGHSLNSGKGEGIASAGKRHSEQP